MYLEELGEHGLIRRIQKRFKSKDRSIVVGIGDDAAIINPSPGKSLIISTDTLREDIHFKKKFYSPSDIGWKAVAVSVSDIAAMGGIPRFLLLSIAVPDKTIVKDIDGLLNGVKDISTLYDIALIGGNISRSKKGITLDTTVMGELPKGKGRLRSGASVGDLIYVTGIVGSSAIGLSLLKSSSVYSTTSLSTSQLISTHLRPLPKVNEGIILSKNKLATAMIDISDGLLADLSHICDQSKVGANIYRDLIPLPDIHLKLKKRLAKEPLFYALYGGEDYELLFTIKKRDREKLEAIFKKKNFDITFIGEITSKDNGIRMVGIDGNKRIIRPGGFDHFISKSGGKIC